MKIACILLLVLLWFLDSSFAVWNFRPAISLSNCLSISGNNDETTFTVAACSATNTYQHFTGAYVGNPFVWLDPYISPNCNLTVFTVDTTTAAGTGNGAPVVTAFYDPADKAQYWARLTPTGGGALPGYVWYQNLATGRCMTMEAGGSYIDTWDCGSGLLNAHQMWLQSPGDPSMSDVGANSILKNQQLLGTLCLNVKKYNPYPGATLDAQPCDTESFAQNFESIPHQGVTWKVVGSGKCMDGNTQMPAAPFQYTCTPAAQNHHWLEFYYLGDAVTRHFMNVATAECLTWNPDNLNDVHTEACGKDNANQKWMRTQPN